MLKEELQLQFILLQIATSSQCIVYNRDSQMMNKMRNKK